MWSMKTEAMKRRDMTNTGTGPTFNPGESSVEVGVREEREGGERKNFTLQRLFASVIPSLLSKCTVAVFQPQDEGIR